MQTSQHIRYIARFSALLCLPLVAGSANTDRDIGPIPAFNRAAVNRWIVFFTNVERVKEGRLPLAYDPLLEKAADYIAEYCVTKLGDISHHINEPGMQSPSDRVQHFGGPMYGVGENLTVIHRANTEYVSYYRKQDEKGEYRDFGEHKLFWRSDRQLAWKMVDSWMHSSGHYANIMRDYASIGAGGAAGVYGGADAAYGAQVFSRALRIDFSKFIWSAEKNEFTYSGKLQPTCFAISGDAQPAVVRVERQGKIYRCAVGGEKRILFAGLYDATEKITYPVAQMR